jgi:hypothetical protein
MVQRGGGTSFAAETLEGLRVPGDILREKFQSDEAAEFGVFGFIDYTHAAAT